MSMAFSDSSSSIWIACQRCGHSMKDHQDIARAVNDPALIYCTTCECTQLRRLTEDGYILEPIGKPTVDHPSHYGGDTTYEAIKVIEAWGLNFNLGNVIKYVRRLTEKGDPIENLEKLIWYANRELELRRAGQGQATEH